MKLLLADEDVELSAEVKQQISCSVVQSFEYKQRCSYVKAAADCQERKYYIHYIKLFFCGFNPQSDFTQALYALTLLSFCWLLFIILATVIDKILCPALKVIAINMRMNEHLAGVTLVAFGGSSPDILTTVASLYTRGEQRGLYSDLVGSGFYVSIFISATIIVLAPFETQGYSTIRDVGFLLFSVLYIDFALRSDECISVKESCAILAIYTVYLIVIIVDQIMLKWQVKKLAMRVSTPFYATAQSIAKLERLKSQAEIDIFSRVSRVSRVTVNIEETRKSQFQPVLPKNENLLPQFWQALNPLDVETFESAGCFRKTSMILKIPINVMLFTFIPIIDYELPRHGWSKLLNCLQIIVLPILIALIFSAFKQYHGVPAFVWTLIGTVPLALLFFFNSRTDVPPVGHLAIGFFSVAGSIIVVYTCAEEVMQILYVIGVVTNSSGEFIGCTMLAWGMAIGDLISNVMLALNGYQKMGYAACFGSPMFNSVLIVGGNYLYKSTKDETECFPTERGELDENCVNFMILGLVFTIVWMLLTNGRARRCVGIFTIGIYVYFFLYTVMCELSILHTFGMDIETFPIL